MMNKYRHQVAQPSRIKHDRRPGASARAKLNAAPTAAVHHATALAAPLLREEIGEVLRGIRRQKGRTLREVSARAKVSLGYLSEVERGQKEASSELLYAICTALDMPLSMVLREVSDRIAAAEGTNIPDTVPDELIRQQGALLS